MEKNRSSKILAMIALLVSVLGLSLGFAAFSRTLTISSSATVNPSINDFKVVFSSSGESVITNAKVPGVTTPSGLSFSEASISNTLISGLNVDFTAPGQKVEYTFYAANIGEYDAYLRSITFKRGDRECTPGEGTTPSLVQNACDDISLKIKVGNDIETSTSMNSISEHLLEKGAFEQITVTIEYAANGARADGDFSVAFGNITLNYGSNAS